jgi:hypothetical protein
MTLTLRSVKGSALTTAEMDANLTHVSPGWQTVTPGSPDTTPIALSYYSSSVAKPGIRLAPPVSSSHVVQPATDCPDGATYEILLKGGGASGLWQAYSSGSPTTHGFVWLTGAAPSAPSSSSLCASIIVRRRGYRHEAAVASYTVDADF